MCVAKQKRETQTDRQTFVSEYGELEGGYTVMKKRSRRGAKKKRGY